MRRNTLLIDLAIALAIAGVILIVAPGLAIVAILAVLAVVVCGVSFAVVAWRRRRGRRTRGGRDGRGGRGGRYSAPPGRRPATRR